MISNMTFYAAISTDIKKSSVNWNELPLWMYEAVKITNNITEDVVERFNSKIRATLLPNAPEGDAYTYYFSHSDKAELKKHVLTIGFTLQAAYEKARKAFILQAMPVTIEKELKTKYDGTAQYNMKYNEFLQTEYYGAIYVRIGIAVSSSPPLQYSFNKLVSYRGGVIDDSERAEAKGAPYKDGVGYTEKGKPVEVLTNFNDLKIDIDDEAVDLALKDRIYNADTVTKAPVEGTMCFVHYHFDINEKEVEKSPHLYKYMQEEFKDLHDGANAILASVDAELVKVKRSSDSMYYIPETATQPQIWKVCRLLVATLPKGSAVGLCYGKNGLNQITYNKLGDRRNGKHDYFGPVVNLAARMEFSEWGYDTLTDRIDVNKHDNRLAMCWYGKKEIPLDCTNQIEKPYLVESVPLSALNAGTDTEYLKIMSCHVLMGKPLEVGDEVYYDDNEKEIKAKIVRFSALYATVNLFSEQKKRYTKYVRQILIANLRRKSKKASTTISNKPLSFKF